MITIPLEIEREELLKRVPFLNVLFEPTGKSCIWIPCAIRGKAPVEYDYSLIEFEDPLEKVTDPWSRKSIQNRLPKDQVEWERHHALTLHYGWLQCGCHLRPKGNIKEIFANDNNWIQVRSTWTNKSFFCRKIIKCGYETYAVDVRGSLPFNSGEAEDLCSRDVVKIDSTSYEFSVCPAIIDIEYDSIDYDAIVRAELKECIVVFDEIGRINISASNCVFKTIRFFRAEDDSTLKEGYEAEGGAFIKNRKEYEYYLNKYLEFAREKGYLIEREEKRIFIHMNFEGLKELNSRYIEEKDFRVIGVKLENVHRYY